MKIERKRQYKYLYHINDSEHSAGRAMGVRKTWEHKATCFHRIELRIEHQDWTRDRHEHREVTHHTRRLTLEIGANSGFGRTRQLSGFSAGFVKVRELSGSDWGLGRSSWSEPSSLRKVSVFFVRARAVSSFETSFIRALSGLEMSFVRFRENSVRLGNVRVEAKDLGFL